MFGYHGRYLRIDLTHGSSTWIALPEDVLRRFLGGVGLATYLMHRECPAGVDPLAPEAPLIFCLSPLVGTPLTTSAKFAVVGKSPLTNRLNDALSSSHFALAAKKAGMDALVITGALSLREPWSSTRARFVSCRRSSSGACPRQMPPPILPTRWALTF